MHLQKCTKDFIGLGINENWQDDDKFWCSEWVAFLCKLIGLDLAYLDDVHRITPKHNLDWEQTTISIGEHNGSQNRNIPRRTDRSSELR